MAKVIINRKWAEMIMMKCRGHNCDDSCPLKETCDDVWIDDEEIAPSLWNLDTMQIKT